MKIINLIKQKKLLENSTDQYDPTAAVEAHWYDTDKADLLLKMREEQGREKFAVNFESSQGEVTKGIDSYDANVEK